MHSMPPGTSTNLMWQTDLFVQNNQKTKVTLLRESTIVSVAGVVAAIRTTKNIYPKCH
jgi:hypothetical protein